MASQVCDRYVDDLSAFTDHTLPKRRWDEVAYHVAGCEGCREAVNELRGICSALSGIGAGPAGAPESLTARLREIAADDCDTPLYMAGGDTVPLPTKRRVRRRGLALGGAAVMTALSSLILVVVMLAPEPSLVRNPVAAARLAHLESTSLVHPEESAVAANGTTARAVSLVSRPATTDLPPADLCPELGCPEALAGLPLVAYERFGRSGIRLIYSDGTRVLTVCWKPGVLRQATQDRILDFTEGAPAVAAWQAGDGVMLVATDASESLLLQALSELPAISRHELPLVERLRLGLERLSGR